MRKIVLVIILLLLIIVGFGIGLYIYKINEHNKNLSLAQKIEDECTEEATLYELGLLNNTVETNISEEKISPNAIIIFETKYNKCGHVLKKYENAENDLINLTQSQLQEKYSDWEIQEFSSKQIILYKEVEESCGEHYVLREKDGYIAIYEIDENNVESLIQITQISTKYITETDLIELNKGIKVNGKEELNSTLEDFE